MINFIATHTVMPIPMCCLRFFVVKKIYHPNSDSKYVLGKVHLYFFWWGEGRVKAVVRILEHFWRGVFFFDFLAPPTIFLYSLHIKLSTYVFAPNMYKYREEITE